MRPGKRRLWLENALFVAAMAVSMVAFDNESLQGANWTYPYFSGAAHLDRSLEWRYSGQGYDRFRALPASGMRDYDFASEQPGSMRPYDWNSRGYLFVVWAAKEITPWLSYINAVVVLQCLVHIGITLLIASLFPKLWQRLLFVAAYGANPLIIHVVTFAMYYFWQVLPAFALLLWLNSRGRSKAAIAGLHLALLAAYMIRPSVVFIVVYVAVVGFALAERKDKALHAVAAGLVALGILLSRQSREPWHTMYVGIGAYSNPRVARLSDEVGFDLFAARTGTVIDTDLSDGNFYEPALNRRYNEVLKTEYLDIAREDPARLMTHAAANTYQSFSVGHVVGNSRLNALSVVLGAVLLAAMVLGGQWLLIGGVLAYAAGYAWFFPPIPAYMFGSYLLLAFAGVSVVAHSRRMTVRG